MPDRAERICMDATGGRPEGILRDGNGLSMGGPPQRTRQISNTGDSVLTRNHFHLLHGKDSVEEPVDIQ